MDDIDKHTRVITRKISDALHAALHDFHYMEYGVKDEGEGSVDFFDKNDAPLGTIKCNIYATGRFPYIRMWLNTNPNVTPQRDSFIVPMYDVGISEFRLCGMNQFTELLCNLYMGWGKEAQNEQR